MRLIDLWPAKGFTNTHRTNDEMRRLSETVGWWDGGSGEVPTFEFVDAPDVLHRDPDWADVLYLGLVVRPGVVDLLLEVVGGCVQVVEVFDERGVAWCYLNVTRVIESIDVDGTLAAGMDIFRWVGLHDEILKVDGNPLFHADRVESVPIHKDSRSRRVFLDERVFDVAVAAGLRGSVAMPVWDSEIGALPFRVS